MKWSGIILLFCLKLARSLDKCHDCLESGNKMMYCIDNQSCNTTFINSTCSEIIDVSLNCPSLPDTEYAYNDTFMRTVQMVLASAVQNTNPQVCFDNQLPTMKFYRKYLVECSTGFPNDPCSGYLAYDLHQKVIAMVFRGSVSSLETSHLIEAFKKGGTVPFFNNGRVAKMIYESFQSLWKAGMYQDLNKLRKMYPNFELWANGHSLGSQLAQIASSYIVKIGMYKPENIKVVLLGAVRLGDYDYASWHTSNFPYTYRIVHRNDFITDLGPYDPVHNLKLYHPKYEVWYNNNMKIGDPFEICQQADGDFCSAKYKTSEDELDHVYYFNIHLPNWGRDGCPKNIDDYGQKD